MSFTLPKANSVISNLTNSRIKKVEVSAAKAYREKSQFCKFNAEKKYQNEMSVDWGAREKDLHSPKSQFQ